MINNNYNNNMCTGRKVGITGITKLIFLLGHNNVLSLTSMLSRALYGVTLLYTDTVKKSIIEENKCIY